ncbi:hypothetical protein PoB_005644100 [Plakobranchus ocellatus]|uniref:Uncharacterized protein n=1 Tax=Plakobranchus ocellatus TaxID=259542 RepID=A0AAV4C3L4_9GAST|nr:hypothetical protein PoB_005644100 [Plakobranchus ocellatus]
MTSPAVGRAYRSVMWRPFQKFSIKSCRELRYVKSIPGAQQKVLPTVHEKVISGFQAFCQARAPVGRTRDRTIPADGGLASLCATNARDNKVHSGYLFVKETADITRYNERF